MGTARDVGTTLAVALIPLALLSGCGATPGEPGAAPSPPASAEPTPTTTPTPTPTPVEFRMPTACAELLPPERIADLEAVGMELLAGPDGKYGDAYLADPTPEQQVGGMTCIWGEEQVPENSVTVSVASLDAATHDEVVAALVAQGLNTRTEGDAVVYERVGDEIAAPAIVNLLREDSWISVIEGLGGTAFHEEAVDIAAEVETQLGAR
ncbi:hypothetical protein [Protaetiibacter intestinalis]|uniref:DUF3558 domain-containing protein n=1 Tax=Protaetiibacter intestinalis TaxID=2419774 RepID=A0A387BD02_9MICO|nr:hypothetical protein [Protaetiibacter intestinalis]AYF98759.1 hypothetical protein D7I47_11200 [Protaetiibacter intestinalis]